MALHETPERTGPGDPFAANRGRLLGLAYRMLGSRCDAEDVLQDAYVRYAGVDAGRIRDVEAYLVRTVTNLCLDRLKSAQAQREVYIGPWLPEPVLDDGELSPQTAAEYAEDLSFALLLTLERLSPPERAAFLLHDVFEVPFAEIAGTLGRSETTARQLAARARKAVRMGRPGRRAAKDAHAALLQEFAAALATGDLERLRTVLAADAVAYNDGGGVKPAALKPVRGADRVARLFHGLQRKVRERGHVVEAVPARINGWPGMLVYLDGALDQTVAVDVVDGFITAIYVVRNPRKLGEPGMRTCA